VGAFIRQAIVRPWGRRAVLVLVVIGLVVYEIRTSTFQAWLLVHCSRWLSYELGVGPSPLIAFPRNGPYDERLGYSGIPAFQSYLEAREFQVVEQARVSPALGRLIRWGISPPYREPIAPGLEIRGPNGEVLYRAAHAEWFFSNFEDVPPLLVRTLLFIENQELETAPSPRTNPVIQWERLAKASLLYLGNKLGLSSSVEGGSTLATQMEKFRHSPQGRTHSALDKVRQLIGASLKAYREGPDTRPRRQEIIIDYLNSVPLSAVPGYGEVSGIGEGLYAWFGLQPNRVWKDLESPELTQAKVQAYKYIIALLVSLPAPSTFLLKDREALTRRANLYTRLLERAGVIDNSFAEALLEAPIRFSTSARLPLAQSFNQEKASDVIHASLLQYLHMPDRYRLDRLHLNVESTLDSDLQGEVIRVFQSLTDPEFVKVQGLNQERLLEGADSRKVIYSLMLFERTPEGNLLRVRADNLDEPLDINKGVKLELGSTAKLRTLAHYLEVVALLHKDFSNLNDKALAQWASRARDPITRWAADTLRKEPGISLKNFIQKALDRRYSASPYETFFTGKGAHTFQNFDPLDNSRILPLREAFQRSTNLVFIRLMRDLVRFHQARLPYDAAALLSDRDHPKRRVILEEEAEEEAKEVLYRAYQRYQGLPSSAIVNRLLDRHAQSVRHQAILFFAWHPNASEDALAAWLKRYRVKSSNIHRLFKAYSNPDLNLGDFGYLLSLHPLNVWCAGELTQTPDLAWEELLARSRAARRISYAWLFHPHNRRAQNLRLRIRIEKDAFLRMTPYWQRLGFPFERLVPSYATAIGSSSDRPSALADLMGIIVNDGVRRPTFELRRLRFASGTPYETALEPRLDSDKRALNSEVAQALKAALEQVVEAGTARRLNGVFRLPDGTPVKVGGKTGSGDNRFRTFDRYGHETSSRVVNRTAAFVFYIGDRYYGVVTTLVPGREAGSFRFTSALPVTVLKLLAPVLIEVPRIASAAGRS
jgi:membrane peptidoglycan carboxypeptidase